MFKKTLLITSLLLASTTSLAGGYTTGFLALDRLEGDNLKLNGTSMNTALGVTFNENVAAEVRLGFGVVGDDFEEGDSSFDIKVGYTTGAYAKVGTHLTRVLNPYVLMGYTHMEVKLSEKGIDQQEDIKGVTMGAGLNLNLSKSTAVNAEISRFEDEYDGEDVTFERITLGLRKRF